MKQKTVSGSGISWAICKSAHRSRQITMPAPTAQFLQAGCPSCRPTNSVKALKEQIRLQITNRKCHMAYRFVPCPTTSNDVEGHSPIARLFKCKSTNICATFCVVLTDVARCMVPRLQLSFLFGLHCMCHAKTCCLNGLSKCLVTQVVCCKNVCFPNFLLPQIT